MATEAIALASHGLKVDEDDIDALRRSLQMPDLPYVDFSARQERRQALARWPLLAEVDALREAGGEVA